MKRWRSCASLLAADPPPNRHALSREFCRRIGWLKPDGGLKDMMARVAMLAMHNDGLIVLPPAQVAAAPAPAHGLRSRHRTAALSPPPTTLDEVRPLSLHTVVRYSREGRLWNEFIARYHYLGYKNPRRRTDALRRPRPPRLAPSPCSASPPPPASSRPGTASSAGPRNCARRTSRWWSTIPSFLILPWIKIPNLGSHILSHRPPPTCPKTGPRATTPLPVLIETFVETPRFTGALYKASGWTHVGATQGRGRYDRHTKRAQPKKDIWLRPLRKHWRRTLNR